MVEDIQGLVETETLEEIIKSVIALNKKKIVCVEVGSFSGKSICYFGQRLKEEGIDFTFYSVDHWKCDNISKETKSWMGVYDNFFEHFKSNVVKCGLQVNIIPLKMDSMEASKTFADKSIDFIFLDGDHTLPYTIREIRAWKPKMKNNSIIAGHDFCEHAVHIAVETELENYSSTSKGDAYICYLQ